MDYETSIGPSDGADLTLPLQVKIIDTSRFVQVDLDEMVIDGDTGRWVLRLRKVSERLNAETSKNLHYVLLHALNGRRKASTVQKWSSEFSLFSRTVNGSQIAVISLEMFNRYAPLKNASQQKILRGILLYWIRLGVKGVSKDLGNYLASSRPPTPRRTAEIQNMEPQERPFPIGEVQAILGQVDDLYAAGVFDDQDNLLWRLIVTVGLRPVQMRLLWVGDVRFEVDDSTGTVRAFLNIAIVKQHGTAGRSYMEEYRMTGAVTAALKNHLSLLTDSLGCSPSPSQPLFSINHTAATEIGMAQEKALSINHKITKTRRHIVGVYPGLEDADLFTRRFRHTKLTHLAILGAPREVLARAGFQTSTVSLARYVNLSEEAFADYETRLGEHHQRIHDAFRGKIIGSSEATNPDFDHAILSPDLDNVIGDCSASPCDVFAPIGCYVCPRFEAFTDGDHTSVLRFLEKREEAARRLNLSDASNQRDAHLRAAVKFVIAQVESSTSGN